MGFKSVTTLESFGHVVVKGRKITVLKTKASSTVSVS